jgi:hypothetical protein
VVAVLRRLTRASVLVVGVGLVAGCAVSPLKMGAAAIVGSQRISIATLDSEVTNLSAAAKQYPGVVTLTQAQATQATLTWLIRYQVQEELARQAGITISTAQAESALASAYAGAKADAAAQGLTNVSLNEVLAGSGIPPDTAAEFGRFEAIETQYVKNANGGTLPSTDNTALDAKFSHAQCLAAKALSIQVSPQFGRLDYTQYTIVAAPSLVTRTAGPAPTASPSGQAPAC